MPSEAGRNASCDICTRLSRVIADLQQSKMEIAELQRSNAELGRFAAAAAHDLRSPLMVFSSCICAIRHEPLSPEVRELTEQAQFGIEQMTTLIKHLLSYARTGQVNLQTMPVDSQATLEAAKTLLAKRIKETGGIVTGDNLPTVKADHTLLVQLLQNLIENSLKYHREKPPRINVSARQSESEWLFSVEDNGIGIPADQLEAVFQPFNRLQAADERDAGAGMGLATCRRIVERHKGRIWAESELGKGTKILFTLPC